MFLVLASSKGISSGVMARLLGVNQKTTWKMGQAIREMMGDRNGELGLLQDIAEVDEAYVGGAPKSLSGACEPRGKGTGKPMIFVAASRDRQARARVVSDDKRAMLEPVFLKWIDPETTRLMTDGNKRDQVLGKPWLRQSTPRCNALWSASTTTLVDNSSSDISTRSSGSGTIASRSGKWSRDGQRKPVSSGRKQRRSGSRSRQSTRWVSCFRRLSASSCGARRHTGYAGLDADAFCLACELTVKCSSGYADCA